MGTRTSITQILAILISYAGIIVTFSQELGLIGGSYDIIIGGLLVFLSALSYASYLVGSGWLIPKFGSTTFTSYAMIVSCTCVIVHYLLSDQRSILIYPAEVYLISFTMAIIATLIPSYLISFAIKGLCASDFSIYGSLGPISTIVLAHLFLDETLNWIQILGTMVVIMGVTFISSNRQT